MSEHALAGVIFGNILTVGADEKQYLRKGKQTDHAGDDGHALNKIIHSEGETGDSGVGIDAHGGNQHAHRAGDKALAHVVHAHYRDGGQAEQTEPEVFRAAELEGETGQGSGEEEQEKASHNTAERGRQQGSIQRLVRAPGLAQRPAVKSGGHGGGSARRADQNGRVRTAVNGSTVDGAQHDKAVDRVHGEGDGHHEGHSHGGGKAGQGSHNDASGQPRDHQKDIQGVKQIENCGQKKFTHN